MVGNEERSMPEITLFTPSLELIYYLDFQGAVP